jgi:hypothetical protein
MKAKSLTTLAAVIVIGAGGFMAGRISSPQAAQDSADSGNPTSSRPTRSSTGSSADGRADSTKRTTRTERSTRKSSESDEERSARLESIVRGEDALDRSRSMLAFIDQLGPGDFENAVEKFRSLGLTESRFGEYAMLLSAWAKADPTAALDYAKENTGTSFATNTILATWAANDPESAIRWAETNHTEEGANPYYAGIIRSIAASDPMRATQLLTSMPRSTERGEALDALRNGAMTRVADKLAETDPAGTASWLLANPGEATQRRMDDVYSAWAQKDQDAALSSMAALPAGENRSNALRGLVTSTAVKDPQAAISMMDRFPNDVTDRVVQNFIWHSFGTDPSTAVNQIARIGNERDREQMYRRAMEAWIERDRDAATAWMQRNTLPPSVIERLNRRLSEQ